MRTVTMLCYNRPTYFLQALEALSKNKELDRFDGIHIFAEPTAVTGMILLLNALAYGTHPLCKVFPCRIFVHRHHTRLGTDKNGYCSQEHVFDVLHSSVNLHIEDDVIVSPDAAYLTLWYEQQPLHEDRMCFCLHHHNGEPVSANQHNLSYTNCVHEFNPYGWAATSANWERWLKKEWFTNKWSPDGKTRYGWDWSLNYHCAFTKQAHTLMPAVSRATTIGEFNGVHMSPEQWRTDFSKQEIYRG